MPTELPKDAIENANAAVAFAQQVRKFHRRRTSRKADQRARDIEVAVQRLKDAMGPLRSEIGRFPYGPQTSIAEANRERIREASAALQRERRKLWKMKEA
jgi:hypothetical protein